MTIIMASKDDTHDLDSSRFPEWDKFVRIPLYFVSDIDVAELFQRNKLADPKTEGQKIFFDAWFNVFGSTPTTAMQAIKKAHFDVASVDNNVGGVRLDSNIEEFGDALKDIFNGKFPTSGGLGKWLGSLIG